MGNLLFNAASSPRLVANYSQHPRLVVWLLRIESKVVRNTEEIKRIEERFVTQRKEDMAERQHQFDSVNTTLLNIQQDIKEILKTNRKD
jgi:guanylate kinase